MPIFSQFGEIVWQRLFNIARILQTTALNNLVVCDEKAGLQIFTLDGKFLSKIEGVHPGLNSPNSVAVSSDGRLFVIDKNENCVRVFQ